jgi:hypothetical protein
MGCVGRIIIVLILTVSIFYIFAATHEQTPTRNWRTDPDPAAACVMMQEFVKRELKAPSTAKFVRPGEIGTRCEYQGNQRYFVRGYVDAQNSYGATVRTGYQGIIEQTGTHSFRKIELVID